MTLRLLLRFETVLWLVLLSVSWSHAAVRRDGSCPVISMFPFSVGHGRWSPKATQKFAFSFLAGSQLAMNHFNARDPSVVPELENLANCDVYFPPQSVLDSSFVGDTAIQALWSATLDQAIQTENNFGVENITHQAGLPCAVLGPMDSRATEEVVAVTSALKIPQLFYHAELDRFYHGGKDNSIATVLSPNARAQIMADMFQQMKRDYIAVIHYGKDGSSDLAEELVDIAGTTGMVVETFQRGFSPGSLDILLDNLFDTGITTVVLNFDNPRALSSLSSGLDVRGMFGDEFLYVISPDAAPTDRIAEIYGGHDAGSPMDKLLSGSLVFDHVDPFRLQKDDSFLLAWRGQGSAFVDTLNELHPLAPDNEAYFQAEPDFFKNYDPSNYVSFVYDAIMTLGFGACNASSSAINDDTGDSGVDLTRLMQGMTQTSFHGASGPISFEKDQTYRASKDITVGLYNIRSDTNGTGKRSYNASLACIWKGASGWGALAESSIIYRNGSTNPPVVLRNIEYNYLSIGVRAIGLSFFALGLFLAFGALVAIIHLRKDAIVQRAQPFFLGLLCVGSSITNFASFTISWDEGAGGSVEQLDVACIATPWFFFIGNITIFSALFTKLLRIDKVLSFRRTSVSAYQVLGPLFVLISIAMLILTLWSVLDPWKWEREWVSKVPAESYGQCTSKNFWLFFAPLVALLVTAELLTAVFAWKTADVPTDFADSRTALYALCAHFQAFCIGVPILAVLGESSVDATFVSRVVLIFIFSVSSVAVVVYPKIYQAFQLRRRPELRISSRVNVTGISAPVHESKKFSGSSKTLKQEPVPDLCNPEGIESV